MAFDGLMKGKRGLIMGVANNHSIAWGIAKALHEAGAELAFSYQGDVFKKRVLPLVEPLKPAALLDCDVSNMASIDAAFAELGKVWDRMDFLVHAIAFSDKEQLNGRYIDTTPENFRQTMDISCYSFTAVAQRGEGIAADVHGLAEILRRGVDIAAIQLFLVGKGDGMNQKIHPVPHFAQLGKGRVDRGHIRNIAV